MLQVTQVVALTVRKFLAKFNSIVQNKKYYAGLAFWGYNEDLSRRNETAKGHFECGVVGIFQTMETTLD